MLKFAPLKFTPRNINSLSLPWIDVLASFRDKFMVFRKSFKRASPCSAASYEVKNTTKSSAYRTNSTPLCSKIYPSDLDKYLKGADLGRRLDERLLREHGNQNARKFRY